MAEAWAEELALALSLSARAADMQLAALQRGGFRVAEKSSRDLVTSVDLEIEQQLLAEIGQRFPADGIVSEEAGAAGRRDAARVWVLDPLDGTNNFAIGIPYFGVSVALLVDGQAVVGAVSEPSRRRTFWAVRGAGAFRDGERLRLAQPPPLERAVIAWVQGHGVVRSPGEDSCLLELERRSRRILRTWAPALNWCYAAEASIAGMVVLRSEEEDLHAGRLIFAEAGGAVQPTLLPGTCVAAPAPLHREILGVARGRLGPESATGA